jgi:hypothetical protein
MGGREWLNIILDAPPSLHPQEIHLLQKLNTSRHPNSQPITTTCSLDPFYDLFNYIEFVAPCTNAERVAIFESDLLSIPMDFLSNHDHETHKALVSGLFELHEYLNEIYLLCCSQGKQTFSILLSFYLI